MLVLGLKVPVVTPPLVFGVSLALGLLAGDSSCMHGESATTSTGASASDPVSSFSLDSGRGMERKFKVLTWGLPCRQLKAVALYEVGSLGCSV